MFHSNEHSSNKILNLHSLLFFGYFPDFFMTNLMRHDLQDEFHQLRKNCPNKSLNLFNPLLGFFLPTNRRKVYGINIYTLYDQYTIVLILFLQFVQYCDTSIPHAHHWLASLCGATVVIYFMTVNSYISNVSYIIIY